MTFSREQEAKKEVGQQSRLQEANGFVIGEIRPIEWGVYWLDPQKGQGLGCQGTKRVQSWLKQLPDTGGRNGGEKKGKREAKSHGTIFSSASKKQKKGPGRKTNLVGGGHGCRALGSRARGKGMST